MKNCSKCNKEKSLDCFYKSTYHKGGYRNDCIDCRKEYELNNKDRFLVRKSLSSKKYRDNNKEKERERQRSDMFRLSRRERYSVRIKEDNTFRLVRSYRAILRRYKTSLKSKDILGCSANDFTLYLESKFEKWMDWNNYGLYNGQINNGWDIDHIIPLSSAKCEEDIIRLNHYTNLQPLCSKVNRNIKKNNI
jgi:hypothetical protein